MKNSKTANINVDIKQLFKKWLDITNSFHNLPSQEKNVLSLLLYYHYITKKDVTNDKIIWKIVFDYDTKNLIKEELDMKDQGLQNVLSKLRKKKIIQDNKIINFFIPDIEKDSKNFKVIFNFNIIDG